MTRRMHLEKTGNESATRPISRGRDEVGRLADSFASMQTSLKTYIKELTETATAKERIESELRVAHDIQMGILPRIFPPFPDRTDLDIYATLLPAREVGGDLYDFFFMDDDHLCFSVGDVSGKGVPASLFMAVTKILIRPKPSDEDGEARPGRRGGGAALWPTKEDREARSRPRWLRFFFL